MFLKKIKWKKKEKKQSWKKEKESNFRKKNKKKKRESWKKKIKKHKKKTIYYCCNLSNSSAPNYTWKMAIVSIYIVLQYIKYILESIYNRSF